MIYDMFYGNPTVDWTRTRWASSKAVISTTFYVVQSRQCLNNNLHLMASCLGGRGSTFSIKARMLFYY